MSAQGWDFSMARSTLVFNVFERIAAQLSERGLAMSIAQTDGPILHVRPQAPEDVATLSHAGATCHHYLKLRDGDLAIVNDPASGGTSLSAITLVTAVAIEPGLDVLMTARFRLSETWGEKAKLDEEGVRIPPTPLAHKGAINRDLLMAIASHPKAPLNFAALVEESAQALFQAARNLKDIANDPKSQFNSASLRRYLEDARKTFDSVLGTKLPLGSANIVKRIPGKKETIKIHLEVSESRVTFDFKGTDSSERLAITELTALGSCIWAVLALIGEEIPINSAVFEHFGVTAPSNTCLSWRNPQGLERGLHIVVPVLCETVAMAFAKLNASLGFATSPGSAALVEIAFATSHKRFTFHVLPGAGATSTSDGSDLLAVWGANPHAALPFSQENAQLEVTALGTKTGTGGKGLKKGGDGALVAVRVKEAGSLSWYLGASSVKHEGLNGGRAGAPAQIEIIRARTAETETIDTLEGAVALHVGDEVRMYGAGGGAYGASPAETK